MALRSTMLADIKAGSKPVRKPPPLPPMLPTADPSLTKWEGPRVRVKLIAGDTFETTSTDVLGKAEYAGSLFRELLDAKVVAHTEAEVKEDDEGQGHDQMIELWFDRNGFSLPIIISVMRGYDRRETAMKMREEQKKELIADCEFYRVPFVKKLLCVASFNSQMMDASYLEIEHPGTIVRSINEARWNCIGVKPQFFHGTHSIKFKILNSKNCSVIFGMLPVKEYKCDQYFSKSMKGVGYNARSGDLYQAGTNSKFAERAYEGDIITVSVNITRDGLDSEMTIDKNDTPLGIVDIIEIVSLKGPFMFTVCIAFPDTEIEIIF